MKRLVSIILLLVSVFASAKGFKEEKSVPYRDSLKDRCVLDIIIPKAEGPLPAVVWFHGGGLTGGNRKGIPSGLKNSGFIIFSVEYRLIPEVPIDGCIDDAAAAVSWVFDNIERYGGRKDMIFVSGHSAGGYLTDMVGLDKKWLAKYDKDPDAIAALIPFSGQVISHFAYRKSLGMSELQPSIDPYAPLFHIRKDAPPIIIVSGDRNMELYGRYEETAYFWRMLKLVGHEETYIYELQGYGHGNMAEPACQILKDHIKRIIKERL